MTSVNIEVKSFEDLIKVTAGMNMSFEARIVRGPGRPKRATLISEDDGERHGVAFARNDGSPGTWLENESFLRGDKRIRRLRFVLPV